VSVFSPDKETDGETMAVRRIAEMTLRFEKWEILMDCPFII
jgi:hypothetical protein